MTNIILSEITPNQQPLRHFEFGFKTSKLAKCNIITELQKAVSMTSTLVFFYRYVSISCIYPGELVGRSVGQL